MKISSADGLKNEFNLGFIMKIWALLWKERSEVRKFYEYMGL